ncbi:hypothetical protein [Actinophytocola sp.]|uniref:hypothetical protein n=1 Tax=Actinophytocola sp. TaxID=1872138 RepID=UPI002ED4B6EE
MSQPPPATPNRVQFRLGAGDLAVRLAERTDNSHDRSAVAKRDLTLFYELLAAALRSIQLTRDEALLCCTAYDRRDGLLAAILDALNAPAPGARHDVDAVAFTARLVQWGPWHRAAVEDAIQRWWLLRDSGADPDDALERVGLVRPDALPE